MVWSEKTSGEVLGDQGMMGTHDMETYKYFKDRKNYSQSNNLASSQQKNNFIFLINCIIELYRNILTSFLFD